MAKKNPTADPKREKDTNNAKGNPISLAPLDFEEALESLLQVKPVKKVAAPKKKSKPKTKK